MNGVLIFRLAVAHQAYDIKSWRLNDNISGACNEIMRIVARGIMAASEAHRNGIFAASRK